MNLPLRKKLVFTALLAATAVVALFLVGELFLRGWLAHRDSLLIVPDDKLGWRAKENVAWTREKHDAAGVTYAVRYRTDARGSRLYGDAATAKTKVLLVGDSFTHAAEVSNDKTYYHVFRDRAGDRAEVFAYGALGYGTLQEAMVAMDWAPALRPDWVIVQATGNDLINNSFALEIDSYGSNNNKRRPYLVSTSTTSQEWAISRRVPKPWPGLHEFAFDHSRMLYYLLSRADRLLLDPAELTTEREIRERGLSWPSFKSASDTTAAILRRLKQQTQPARVAVFIVDADEPYVTAFRRACAAADVAFTTAAAEAIHEAETQGRIVRGFDRVHWNELGHQVAAEALVTFFREASSELGLPGAP